jgi:hypothetical protein
MTIVRIRALTTLLLALLGVAVMTAGADAQSPAPAPDAPAPNPLDLQPRRDFYELRRDADPRRGDGQATQPDGERPGDPARDDDAYTTRPGVQRGVDAQGNVWQYDWRTGRGFNSRGRPSVGPGTCY